MFVNRRGYIRRTYLLEGHTGWQLRYLKIGIVAHILRVQVQPMTLVKLCFRYQQRANALEPLSEVRVLFCALERVRTKCNGFVTLIPHERMAFAIASNILLQPILNTRRNRVGAMSAHLTRPACYGPDLRTSRTFLELDLRRTLGTEPACKWLYDTAAHSVSHICQRLHCAHLQILSSQDQYRTLSSRRPCSCQGPCWSVLTACPPRSWYESKSRLAPIRGFPEALLCSATETDRHPAHLR